MIETALNLFRMNPVAPASGSEISAWLRGQLAEGSECQLPAGVFYLDAPIVAPRKSGVKIVGKGSCDPNTWKGQFKGCSTTLIYRGPRDTPAITFTGNKHLFKGVTLLGRTGQVAIRPNLGLLLAKRHAGLGSAGVVEDCVFHGFDVAAQAGEKPTDHNCDNTDWIKCDFSDCPTAYRQVNSQAMKHRFVSCRFYGARAFSIDGGGALLVENCTSFRGPLLTFTDASPRKYRTGPNNSQIVVTDLKVDAQHNGTFRLIDAQAPNDAHVIVERGIVSGPTDWRIGELAEGMRLTVRDLDWNTPPADGRAAHSFAEAR